MCQCVSEKVKTDYSRDYFVYGMGVECACQWEEHLGTGFDAVIHAHSKYSVYLRVSRAPPPYEWGGRLHQRVNIARRFLRAKPAHSSEDTRCTSKQYDENCVCVCACVRECVRA